MERSRLTRAWLPRVVVEAEEAYLVARGAAEVVAEAEEAHLVVAKDAEAEVAKAISPPLIKELEEAITLMETVTCVGRKAISPLSVKGGTQLPSSTQNPLSLPSNRLS